MSTEKQIQVVEEKSSITINEHGQIVTKNLEEEQRFASYLIKNSAVPTSFANAAQVLVAIRYARELNMPPMMLLQNLAVINGQVSMWGEAPMAIVYRSGLLEEIDVFTIDSVGKKISFMNKNLTEVPAAAVCTVKRKGQVTQEFFYTDEEAKLNPNYNKPTWQKYKRTMLMRRARAQALKFVFADCLMGIPIAEYNFNSAPDLEIEPQTRPAFIARLTNAEEEPETEKRVQDKTVFDMSATADARESSRSGPYPDMENHAGGFDVEHHTVMS